MRKILGLSILLAGAVLAGCGDSTLYGDPPPSTQGPPAQTMTLLTSTPQIPSDGSTGATITAIVRGAQNEFLSGVPINFSASSGGLTAASATTDQNGSATTTLTSAGDPVNRTITVTASNGPVTQQINVDVTGTQLTLSGPNSLVLGGTAGQYTATLVDSGGNGLNGRTVNLASSNGATIQPAASLTTDNNGQATFNVTATAAGAGTLTATALGLSAAAPIVVSSDTFAFQNPAENAGINLGQVVNVDTIWQSGGVAVVGQAVTFATTRGTLSASSANTDGGGIATVTLSSTNAGPASITATTATGVTIQRTVNFIATTPTSLVLQSSPSNVPINTQSTITAIVRDAANNLVANQRVNFNLVDVTGGTLSVASAVTDLQGRAQTIYTASSTTSASNGVIINASMQNFPAVTGQATLTVGGRSVFISLGTGNSINEPNQTQYFIEYSAQALDAAGNGLDGIDISFTLHALDYRKGFRTLPCLSCRWTTTYTTVAPHCASEDLNTLNGQLDPGEDANNDGRLTPGDIAAVSPGTVTTSNGGTATIRITYPQDHAYYARVRLIATAVVQGTQTSTAANFLLQGAAPDYSNSNVTPPGFESPFGIGTSCADTL